MKRKKKDTEGKKRRKNKITRKTGTMREKQRIHHTASSKR
jgi:hypothetical protein